MKIHDAHDFDARQAAEDLVQHGFTAVDDITGELVGCAEDGLLDELGFSADELDLGVEELETSWGPVLVFWDRERGDLEARRGPSCGRGGRRIGDSG